MQLIFSGGGDRCFNVAIWADTLAIAAVAYSLGCLKHMLFWISLTILPVLALIKVLWLRHPSAHATQIPPVTNSLPPRQSPDVLHEWCAYQYSLPQYYVMEMTFDFQKFVLMPHSAVKINGMRVSMARFVFYPLVAPLQCQFRVVCSPLHGGTPPQHFRGRCFCISKQTLTTRRLGWGSAGWFLWSFCPTF